MPNALTRKVSKALDNPGLAWNLIQSQVLRAIGPREYISTADNRSESERGSYVACVQKAALHYRHFRNFKRHPSYQAILEHVRADMGAQYIELIRRQSPHLLERIDALRENDRVGNPITHDYPDIGRFSPTTLRYIKVASDLERFFGRAALQGRVAEIGAGYGGQVLINDRLFGFTRHDLFDLPPVLALISRYLESFALEGSYRTLTLNQHDGSQDYDLAISNLAFSELPSRLQRLYIRKVLSRAKRGYMVMDSGFPQSEFTEDHLGIAELRELLPPFEVVEEVPASAPHNYIIVWGARPGSTG
jgi:putative sugar O-methyltransferase